VTGPDREPRGRTVIERKAFEHTIAAIAAAELGVPARRVSVTLGDRAALLAVRVSGPLRHRRGTSVLAAAERTRQRVLADGDRLLGTKFADVTIGITGVTLTDDAARPTRRVR
jgi:CO/xanthine dehydrogenase Mo-binding subunit